MLEQGMVKPSDSPFVSPVIFVKKKNTHGGVCKIIDS